VLSREEVARLINAAGTLFRRTLLMTLYSTGMRRSELAYLKVSDIDSQRMILRVVEGKGGKDRDLPLSPALLETLREYWHWRMPKTYLFPSRDPRRGSEQPISDKTVWATGQAIIAGWTGSGGGSEITAGGAGHYPAHERSWRTTAENRG
jgi:integrase/recombinase XerD